MRSGARPLFQKRREDLIPGHADREAVGIADDEGNNALERGFSTVETRHAESWTSGEAQEAHSGLILGADPRRGTEFGMICRNPLRDRVRMGAGFGCLVFRRCSSARAALRIR
jgi:hypothetical protein